MKEQWGQWAYGISAFKDLDHPEKTYKISLDGHTFRLEAVALTITNIGNIGKKGFSFLPGIKVDDGFLDIIALNHADFISLFKITGTTLLQKESSVLKHWKAKSIRIEMDEPISFICDDIEVTASGIDIMVSPKSLNVVIPNRKSP
jgi:diacylglycerol kinase family enzyme